jgi:hypothetical protein
MRKINRVMFWRSSLTIPHFIPNVFDLSTNNNYYEIMNKKIVPIAAVLSIASLTIYAMLKVHAIAKSIDIPVYTPTPDDETTNEE